MRTMRGYSYRSHNDDDGDDDDDDGGDGDGDDVADEYLSMEASHGKGVAVTRQWMTSFASLKDHFMWST